MDFQLRIRNTTMKATRPVCVLASCLALSFATVSFWALVLYVFGMRGLLPAAGVALIVAGASGIVAYVAEKNWQEN